MFVGVTVKVLELVSPQTMLVLVGESVNVGNKALVIAYVQEEYATFDSDV